MVAGLTPRWTPSMKMKAPAGVVVTEREPIVSCWAGAVPAPWGLLRLCCVTCVVAARNYGDGLLSVPARQGCCSCYGSGRCLCKGNTCPDRGGCCGYRCRDWDKGCLDIRHLLVAYHNRSGIIVVSRTMRKSKRDCFLIHRPFVQYSVCPRCQPLGFPSIITMPLEEWIKYYRSIVPQLR